MDQRDFDPTLPDADDEMPENPLVVNCMQVVVNLEEGEPICDVDKLVQ